jgi:hypothetical protein
MVRMDETEEECGTQGDQKHRDVAEFSVFTCQKTVEHHGSTSATATWPLMVDHGRLFHNCTIGRYERSGDRMRVRWLHDGGRPVCPSSLHPWMLRLA